MSPFSESKMTRSMSLSIQTKESRAFPLKYALLTALKASSRFLWDVGVCVVLEFDFLDGLLDEGFLFWGSAGGGTCSLFCFFPAFSKPSNRVSDIFRGAKENSVVVRKPLHRCMSLWFGNAASFQTSSFCLWVIHSPCVLKMKLILQTMTFPSPLTPLPLRIFLVLSTLPLWLRNSLSLPKIIFMQYLLQFPKEYS